MSGIRESKRVKMNRYEAAIIRRMQEQIEKLERFRILLWTRPLVGDVSTHLREYLRND